MNKKVAVLNQKGGAGKTTISTNLSHALMANNEKVLLVDSDPQGSARDWHAAGNGEILQVIGIDRPTLDKDIRSVSGSYDWVIIDGAPQLSNMAVAAIKCADVILIPIQPSPYDIWAADELVQLIKERQSITEGKLKAAFVISRQINNTKLGKEVREALAGYGLPVFNNGTFQRVIYAQTAALGSTVLHTDPACDASREIYSLAQELRDFSL